MRVIALSGKAGSGKSTIAKYIQLYYENQGNVVKVVSFATRLKQILYSLGWDGNKDEKGRTLLQNIGQELKKYHGENYFAKYLVDSLYFEKNKLDNDIIYIIDDLRFKVELKELKNRVDNLFTIRIDRPLNILTEKQIKDISETDLDKVVFDYYLTNNKTIKELKQEINFILTEVI